MVHRFLNSKDPSKRPIISWRNDLRRALTIVDVVAKDRSALFEKITGGFSVAGLNILGARAVTRKDGIAIDVFYVEEEKGGVVNNSKTRGRCDRPPGRWAPSAVWRPGRVRRGAFCSCLPGWRSGCCRCRKGKDGRACRTCR